MTYSSAGDFLSSVVVADVNGDGKPDAVVGNQNSGTNGTIAVLLGNGNGTFQPAVTYTAPSNCCSLAVADLRGNGKLDLVVASSATGASQPYPAGIVSVMLGNGDGTFNAPVSYQSGGYQSSAVAVVDVNGDGRPDLIVANSYFGVRLLLC